MKKLALQTQIDDLIKSIRIKARDEKFVCDQNIFNGRLNTGDPSLVTEIELRKTLTVLEELDRYREEIYNANLMEEAYSNFLKTIHWSMQVNFLGDYLPEVIDLHQNCSNILNWCFYNSVGGSTVRGNFLAYLEEPLNNLYMVLVDGLSSGHLDANGVWNQELLKKLKSLEDITKLANANNEAIFKPINDFYEAVEKCIGSISMNWSMINVKDTVMETSIEHSKVLISLGEEPKEADNIEHDWVSKLHGIGLQISRNYLLKYSDPKYNTQQLMEKISSKAFKEANTKEAFRNIKSRMILSTTLKLYTIEAQDVS